MAYDPNRHNRRSIRLPKREYVQPGAYFVTICTKDRMCNFGDVINGVMVLSEWGAVVQERWQALPLHHPNVSLDVFVVMPNHLHGIVVISDGIDMSGRAQQAAPLHHEGMHILPGSLNAIIRSFKASVTARIRKMIGNPFIQIWQRNYHEHVIRESSSIDRIRDYFIGNPGRWENDPENLRKFS